MNTTNLRSNWKVTYNGETVSASLPYDCYLTASRDFDIPCGAVNGYYHSGTAVFQRVLPLGRHDNASVKLSGVLGVAHVYLNDEYKGTVMGSQPALVSLGSLTGRNVLKIAVSSNAQLSDRYVGLGIGGEVSLVYSGNTVFELEYESIRTKTVELGDRAKISATVDVTNKSQNAERAFLEFTVYNARGKRVTKKRRIIKMRSGTKSFTAFLKLARPVPYTLTDPYKYSITVTVNIIGAQGEVVCCDKESAPLGIKHVVLNKLRGLYVNNMQTKLIGSTIGLNVGLLGGISNYAAESYRLEKIKESGYNAVRIEGVPSPATLDALDDSGLLAVVDIFSNWLTPSAPLSSVDFKAEFAAKIERSVKQLRNHPSIIMYSLGEDLPESYGRSDGYAIAEMLVNEVKLYDDKPVTCGVGELVPTVCELERLGPRVRSDDETPSALINLGRERNLFDTLTNDFVNKFDIIGYNYLHSRYITDCEKGFIIGLKSKPQKAVEVLDALNADYRIIGDFSEKAEDYHGGASEGLFNTDGEFDVIGMPKPDNFYRRVALGDKHVSFIFTRHPETGELNDVWNYTRFLGQPITVKVYTGGDVVALYSDGRIVGRKLAGKVNGRVASFSVPYYPGTLEAVSYFKGVECSRATVQSVGTPKQIKLVCAKKSADFDRGDITFVRCDVCDKEGRTVKFAARSLKAAIVSGDGELVAFYNADPDQKQIERDVSEVHGGSAIAAVRATKPGKLTLKVSGDGLLAGKITLKFRSAEAETLEKSKRR